MTLTKSQFEAQNTGVLLQQAEAFTSIVGTMQKDRDNIVSAQNTVTNQFQGKAAEAELAAMKTGLAQFDKSLEAATKLQTTLASVADTMSQAKNAVNTQLQQAVQNGYTVNDNWQLQSTGRPTMSRASSQQQIQEQLTKAVSDYSEKDEESANKLKQVNGGEAPKSKDEGKDKDGKDQGAGSENPTDGKTSTDGKGNGADVAKQFLGENAEDLKRSGKLPMDSSIPSDICCANFVSASLQKAGLIDFHTNSVADLHDRLVAKGWTVTSNPSPGAVAIINGSEHTELVASNSGGKIGLIGSNNVNADGSQKISYGNPYGNIVYLQPPA
ncbi:WXG100 family type VII secretion target [Segniliparus rugosus]|uniref:Uncharacterized protein n=1 Tax=Segniliparus rugosus (strain ATCC BAA-974 / DSM 45345 / CCUG 50838 / CIP 108380 / JCM 13579 / CDC 945) TaxID=679197 RepID=E5XTV0_SEGRC|nr:hypothetical protein [Segniliparus rugosus]EFV12230.1 hypothetical protein HMPREF9336_02922 [Segniliparus rugosus ATCC BAA-974]